MNQLSVVLISKNEAHIIGDTIRSVKQISDDIIVVDSGSTDDTCAIAQSFGAHVISTKWDGFGANKNKGVAAAKHNWILSIDCDEMPDDTLCRTLETIDLSDPETVYNISFKTFLGSKLIRHGEWGRDAHIRLFNGKKVTWNNALVHEQLILPPGIKVKNADGYLLHYTMTDLADLATKMTRYAVLNAERYHQQGKKAGWLKRRLSPTFSFIQNYFFKLGFLDGREGYLIARISAYYTFLKYERLYELNRLNNA